MQNCELNRTGFYATEFILLLTNHCLICITDERLLLKVLMKINKSKAARKGVLRENFQKMRRRRDNMIVEKTISVANEGCVFGKGERKVLKHFSVMLGPISSTKQDTGCQKGGMNQASKGY